MKTVYETEIGIEKKIIILTTKTVEFLLSKNPDSLSLYMFYIKNAKIQKTNSIFNVEAFGMKGLGWGRDRYRNAKAVLVNEKFIEDVIKRNKNGQIEGHFLKINYLFAEDTVKDTLERITHPVVQSSGSEEETNALSNKTENALSNIKDTAKAEEVPFIFQDELKKLKNSTWKPHKIIALFFIRKGWTFENKKQFDTNVSRYLRDARSLEGYTGQQISDTMDFCEDKYRDVDWKLSTVIKSIASVTKK